MFPLVHSLISLDRMIAQSILSVWANIFIDKNKKKIENCETLLRFDIYLTFIDGKANEFEKVMFQFSYPDVTYSL